MYGRNFGTDAGTIIEVEFVDLDESFTNVTLVNDGEIVATSMCIDLIVA